MVNPLQQTTGVDVDAKPEQVVQQSQAPTTGGPAKSAMPTVGTNAVSQWSTWDPNQWWTDWSLPQDPRPSWERWFDWVNQLKALVPALGEASKDWETMIGQFDNSLQTVRGMRADLASWTGPSAQTMGQSLDRLENSITTKTSAIRGNPAKLQQLAQTINDAVGPMTALDAEYQQVLQDLNACRQVALRGKPIMLNLATQLLKTGTDLENSVQSENLAPQPTPPQQVTLTDGPQGPGNQLAQVAGSSNLADPGNVTMAGQVPIADQPTVAGASGVGDSGVVHGAQQQAMAHAPGVSVAPSDSTSATAAMPAQPAAHVAATPTLAGASAGGAAPVASMPAAVTPTMSAAPMAAGPSMAPIAAVPTMSPVPTPGRPTAPVGTASTASGGSAHEAPTADKATAPPVVAPVPLVTGAVVATPVATGTGPSGSVAVPAGLQGRGAVGSTAATTAVTGVVRHRGKPETLRVQEETEVLDAEAFEAGDAGTGTLTGRASRA